MTKSIMRVPVTVMVFKVIMLNIHRNNDDVFIHLDLSRFLH